MDYLLQNFALHKSIMEITSPNESLWEDHHYRYYFLPNVNSVDSDCVSLISSDIVDHPHTHVFLQYVESKGNLCNITQTIPIDISVNPRVVEHVHDGHNYSTTKIEEYEALFKEF